MACLLTRATGVWCCNGISSARRAGRSHGVLSAPKGENHEDASCCRHSCDGDRSPHSGEGEAGEIGAPARLSVVGATRLLPRLPSAGLVPRRVIELLIFGVDGS